MALITAHLVVQFSDAADNLNAVLEIDDRDNGYNAGKTTFYPGDQPAMLLFMPTGYVVDTIVTSAGNVTLIGDTTKLIESDYVFANEDTSSLTYPHSSGFSYYWMGVDAGALSVSNQFEVKLPTRPIDPVSNLPVPPYRVGVARATYTSDAKAYRLSAVPTNVTQVIVYFVLRPL